MQPNVYSYKHMVIFFWFDHTNPCTWLAQQTLRRYRNSPAAVIHPLYTNLRTSNDFRYQVKGCPYIKSSAEGGVLLSKYDN